MHGLAGSNTASPTIQSPAFPNNPSRYLYRHRDLIYSRRVASLIAPSSFPANKEQQKGVLASNSHDCFDSKFGPCGQVSKNLVYFPLVKSLWWWSITPGRDPAVSCARPRSRSRPHPHLRPQLRNMTCPVFMIVLLLTSLCPACPPA